MGGMNTPPTTLSITCARSDFALIGLSTRYARQKRARDTEEGKTWRETIIDGSSLAPSWRRLPGGEAMWDLEGGDTEAYVEELDRLVETFNASSDCHLLWEEGVLLVEFVPEEV